MSTPVLERLVTKALRSENISEASAALTKARQIKPKGMLPVATTNRQLEEENKNLKKISQRLLRATQDLIVMVFVLGVVAVIQLIVIIMMIVF